MNDGVSLWRLNLDAAEEERLALYQTLSDDERARATRFHFSVDRDRYIVGRGKLRKILAGLLPLSASEICFIYNPFGKPALARDPKLQFNLSHSDNVGLLAISCKYEIGADVEKIRDHNDLALVAAEVFSQREIHRLAQTTPEEYPSLFYKFWTLKEAYLKGVGTGLSESLRDICTVADENLDGWSLLSLDLGAGICRCARRERSLTAAR